MTRTRWILLTITGLLVLLVSMLFRGDLPAAEVDAKYSSDASRFLSMANGARVHYRDEGNADGTAVVLIHGAMASLHTWEGWVTALGENYRLITLDLPAHGLTGAAPADAKN
ncbi:MAG: alpha/beta hydrolase, partial [Gammaproteobacteria bacterium]|nr:alpha/beta hydrolase [Gammaproteobacteria bacterium]